MKKCKIETVALSVLLVIWLAGVYASAQASTINWTSTNQNVVGFGGANQGQFADMTSAMHALVFGNGSGQLGLSVLRSGVADSGGDFGDCTTINSNCAGRITDTQSVAAAGGIMIGMPLSPPASMKTNGSTTCTGGSGNGMLLTGSYGAFATYLSNWIASVKNFAGVTPYALSVQNEPDFCPPYDGTLYSGSQLQTFIKNNLGPTLAANGQTSTLISLSDAAHYSGLSAVASPCAGDSACNAFVGAYSFHPYDATVSGSTVSPNMVLPGGLSTAKGYWATEMSQGTNYGPACGSYTSFTNTIADALCWGAIVDQLENNNANMVLYWQIIDFAGTAPPTATNGSLISNPASGSVVAKRAYMLAQYSKFVRPGYQRIAATARPLSTVSVTAYKSGNNLSVVLTNYDSSSHAITLNLINAPTFSSLTPTITSASQNIVSLASVPVSGNSITYTVPAQSIVTLVGTGSGTTFSFTTATAGTGTGTVNCSPAAGTYASGTSISCTATPNSGSIFSSWTGLLSGTSNPGTFSLTSNGTVTANFSTGGSTINAASCNTVDVQSALNAVTASTSLVTIPAGVCNWTTKIVWAVPAGNTNLTIQGAGTTNCTGTAGASSWACTATDTTVIKDSITSSANDPPWTITLPAAGAFFRMTGITFQGGTGVVKNDGMLVFNGASHSFRADHMHFNPTTYSVTFSTFSMQVYGDVQGVIDHTVCDNGGSGTTSNCVGAFNAIGDTIGFGDGTWANPTGFGSSAFLFMENDVFNGGEAQDCADGGKFVIRYSTINNGSNGSAPIHDHGTKTQAGRGRGCRAYEAYNNYNAGPSPNADALIGSAGGTSLIHHNTLASGRNWFMAWSTTRNDGSATETNTPNGWGYCGTTINGNGVGSAWDGNTNAGTGFPCMDAVGRGQGQAMNGQNWPNALNTATGSISWLHQFREPTYVVENTILNGAAGVRVNSGGGADTDNNGVYWDAGTGHTGCTGAFNGTCGTGHGNLSAMPATCTAGPGGTFNTSPTGSYGVAYYADDTNALYVCTATNTWTNIYTPFTYPHPLAGGTPQAVTPTFAPGAGTYTTPQSVVISTTTPSATIFYTTNGTIPTTSSTVYTTPVNISTTTTLQAIATASGFLQSSVGSALYTLNPTCGNPTQNSPFSGTYTSPPTTLPLVITWNSPTSGCVLHYTTDGSAPTSGSPVFPVGGLSISTTTSIRIIASQAGFTDSSIIGGTWTINSIFSLTIVSTGTGTGTIGGTNCAIGTTSPTTGSTVICNTTPSGGASVSSSGTGSASACSGSTCTFVFNSNSTLTYTFSALIPTPTFLPIAGTYGLSQNVAISDTQAGVTLCYTTDGSTPTSDGAGTCVHGSTYSSPISVTTSLTLKAIGSASTFADSAVGSAAYVITGGLLPPSITGNITFSGNISIQ